MRVNWLAVQDFRNYTAAELHLAPDGLTVVIGENGQGKTNLLEALAWLATLTSFRGAPNDALVRQGATSAFVRAEVDRDGRAAHARSRSAAAGFAACARERQAAARSARPARRDSRERVQPRRSCSDQGRARRASATARRRARGVDTRSTPRRSPPSTAYCVNVARCCAKPVAKQRPKIVTTLDVWDTKLAEHGAALATARRDTGGATGTGGRQGVRRCGRGRGHGRYAVRAVVGQRR